MQSTRLKVIMALLVVLVMVLSGMVFLVDNAPSSSNSSALGQLSVSHSTTGTRINHSSPPAANSGSKTKVLSLAEREKLQQSAIQQAKQLGIPMKYLYLPDYTSKTTILNGHVTPGYISSPAPMGVADYGLMNQSGTIVTYNYTTSSFMASINLNNFSDFNLGDNAPQSVSMQLNSVLDNVALLGNDSYNMWTQNVIFLSPRTHTIEFLDNVWNFSSPTAVMNPSTILYSSAVASGHGQNTYYHYGYSAVYNITFPLSINVYLNSTLVNNNSAVFFNYSVPQDHLSGTYDEVVFNSTYGQSSSYTAPDPHYFVSGTQVTPTGFIPYDAEIMIGGPGGGSTADISQINGTMNLEYMNATTSSYHNVRAAYDIGSQTGETSTGIDVSYSGSTAYLQTGPSLVYGLWNNTYIQTKYSITYRYVMNSSITFTGNVAKDFSGALLYHQTGTSGYGSSNNITNMYVAYNKTDLFIGLQEYISGNSLVLYILNNTNSGYGATNMSTYSPWGLDGMRLSRAANEIFTVYYTSGNINGTNKMDKITSLTTASAITASPISYKVLFTPTYNSTELMVPLSEIGPAYSNGVLNISLAAFVIGGSGFYVGTGIPYNQPETYPNAYPNYFNVTNYINTIDYVPVSSSPFIFVQSNVSLATLYLMYGWSPSVEFVLPTANYMFQVLNNYYDPVSGILSNSGSTNVVMVKNVSMGIYTPIIANSNSQLAGLAQSGNGTISNPYIIYAKGFLDPLFGQFNDFLFQVFPGTLLSNTTAYTQILDSCMEVGYLGYWALDINFLDAVYGLSMPDFNLLPTELYNASNIAIVGGLFATWYFADDFANAASIMVWNSTHVYITENEIESLGIGLLVYNPPYQVANITIYRNEFIGLNFLQFYGETSSINQELAFDSSFDNGAAQYGLQMYSSGNFVFYNEFATQTPVFSPEFNFYEGTPAPYYDYWNNTTTGNAYWNYNLVSPFNESGMISSGYDHFPDSFVSGANVTFETGLSYTSNLSIAVFGLISSGVNNITLYKLFSLGETVDYYAVYGDPTTGSANFTVTSYNYTVNLSKVTLVNSLTFYEFDLPAGTNWSVTLGTQTLSSSGTSITFNEPDGNYSYLVASSNKSFEPLNSSGYINYSEPTSITISFVPVEYNVTFTETGLPSGTAWYVNITGMASSGPITSTSYTTSLMNGSYTFSVSTDNKSFSPSYTSSFTVNGAPVSVMVTFNELYAVTFTETGLPSGTAWYVNITGMASSGPITSTSSTIVLMEPNGSYTFSVSTDNKSFSPSYTSSFTVNGAPVSVAIKFVEVLYKVTFTETGLPAGSAWSVTLNGVTNTSTSSTIVLMEPNGSYTFSVSTTNPAYGPSAATSTFTVKGAAQSVSVSFTPLTFTVTFTETGLPSGTTWYINLSDGKSLSSTNSTITVSLTNGTYNYTASSSGYKQKTGSITLNDNSVTVTVAFEKLSTVTPAKPVSYLVYVLIGVIVATIVIASAVLLMTRKK